MNSLATNTTKGKWEGWRIKTDSSGHEVIFRILSAKGLKFCSVAVPSANLLWVPHNLERGGCDIQRVGL